MERVEFARLSRAVDVADADLEAQGFYAGGPARGPVYRKRTRSTLRSVFIRCWNGIEPENEIPALAECCPPEPHTGYVTARGQAQIHGTGKSAAHALLTKLDRFGVIGLNGFHRRHGEAGYVSETKGSHKLWLTPSRWRLNERYAQILAGVAEDGMEVAPSPPGSLQNRTRDEPTVRGFSPTVSLQFDSAQPKFQTEPPERPVSRSSLPAQPQAEMARGALPVPVPPCEPLLDDLGKATRDLVRGTVKAVKLGALNDPVHPEGGDLLRVLSRNAPPSILRRVARRYGLNFQARVRFHAKAEKLRKVTVAEVGEAPPPSTTAPSISALEASCRRLETLPTRPETVLPKAQPPIPVVARTEVESPPARIGHNGGPPIEAPFRSKKGHANVEPEPERDQYGQTAFDRYAAEILFKLNPPRAGPPS